MLVVQGLPEAEMKNASLRRKGKWIYTDLHAWSRKAVTNMDIMVTSVKCVTFALALCSSCRSHSS